MTKTFREQLEEILNELAGWASVDYHQPEGENSEVIDVDKALAQITSLVERLIDESYPDDSDSMTYYDKLIAKLKE